MVVLIFQCICLSDIFDDYLTIVTEGKCLALSVQLCPFVESRRTRQVTYCVQVYCIHERNHNRIPSPVSGAPHLLFLAAT